MIFLVGNGSDPGLADFFGQSQLQSSEAAFFEIVQGKDLKLITQFDFMLEYCFDPIQERYYQSRFLLLFFRELLPLLYFRGSDEGVMGVLLDAGVVAEGLILVRKEGWVLG